MAEVVAFVNAAARINSKVPRTNSRYLGIELGMPKSAFFEAATRVRAVRFSNLCCEFLGVDFDALDQRAKVIAVITSCGF